MNLSETIEVLKAVAALEEQGRPMALATIVSVRGSTYRRPGARLLVPDRGASVGNLSGGCLEGEVEELGRRVMTEGSSTLKLYDLTADDEVVWGWGLGCNGAIEVFIEPAGRAKEVAGALAEAIEQERRLAVVTVIESAGAPVDVGARLMLYPGDGRRGSTGNAAVDDDLEAVAAAALKNDRTEARWVDVTEGRVRVFVESVTPPLRLLVCGAGHDAIPVVALASSLGWSTVVVDDRKEFLNRERFPGARELVHAQPEQVVAKAGCSPHCYAVVMSHNYLRDRAYLKAFLPSAVSYIGMLGPRARLQRLIADLESEGVRPTDDQLARVHGPAGLDVGAEGPEEIAVAIAAEVLAVSRSRSAGFLRERRGTIHDHLEAVGS